jgi:hypothetical protein
VLLLATAENAQNIRRNAENANQFYPKKMWPEISRCLGKDHNIYGTYAEGFPGAKIQQQLQAPKPHIDGSILIVCLI